MLRLSLHCPRISSRFNLAFEKRIQNHLKHLRWYVLQRLDNDFYPLIIFAKRSILDIWQNSEYAFDFYFSYKVVLVWDADKFW